MDQNLSYGLQLIGREWRISGMGYTLLCAAASLTSWVGAESHDRPNILFIAVDDLRPDIKAYGSDFMRTPHMDRIAEEGRLFQRHYVQVPTCGASRYSLLTGQYPQRQVSWGNGAFALFREGHAPASFPQWFREHGYRTAQTGKISHSPDGFRLDQARIAETGIPNTYRNAPHKHFSNPADPEVPEAWDEFNTPVGKWGTGWGAFFAYDCGDTRKSGESPPLEWADVDDTGYPDGLMGDTAVAMLAKLSERPEPFFYAVGLYKPHLPFNAPKKYWDLYDRDAIDISRVHPRGRGGEFFGGYGHTTADLEDPDYVRELIHGYFACISYVDAQVGKLLDALDDLGLSDNTIVVLWGDHGYHLGELGFWGKHTLHEYSLRPAFMIRTPDMLQPGVATNGITSSVDIYPTLIELAGLRMPEHLDGKSFVGLLKDPEADLAGYAIGFWQNNYTLRTNRYRLIGIGEDARLYDHESDPGEEKNIAASHPQIVSDLQDQLQKVLDRRKAQ